MKKKMFGLLPLLLVMTLTSCGEKELSGVARAAAAKGAIDAYTNGTVVLPANKSFGAEIDLNSEIEGTATLKTTKTNTDSTKTTDETSATIKNSLSLNAKAAAILSGDNQSITLYGKGKDTGSFSNTDSEGKTEYAFSGEAETKNEISDNLYSSTSLKSSYSVNENKSSFEGDKLFYSKTTSMTLINNFLNKFFGTESFADLEKLPAITITDEQKEDLIEDFSGITDSTAYSIKLLQDGNNTKFSFDINNSYLLSLNGTNIAVSENEILEKITDIIGNVGDLIGSTSSDLASLVPTFTKDSKISFYATLGADYLPVKAGIDLDLGNVSFTYKTEEKSYDSLVLVATEGNFSFKALKLDLKLELSYGDKVKKACDLTDSEKKNILEKGTALDNQVL